MIPPGHPAFSQGWGDKGNLSGGQDLVARFKDTFQPDAGIFSPNFPMVPVERERARLWDYPVGYNYIFTPRSYEPVSFAELHALANNEALTALAIETRKDQIEKLDWEIKPRDEKAQRKKGASGEATIKLLTEFWRHPDGERPFGSWLRESLHDVLVTDAPTFEVLRNRDGTIRGLDIINGSTIKLIIDITGRAPDPPAPAYEQIIKGRPWRLFTKEELVYLPRNKRPGHIYGYAPVEQILMFINIALRRQIAQLNWFTEGNVPKGLVNAPDGWGAQQLADAQQWFDSVLAGNLAERSKAIWAPYGSKYQAIKEAPLKDEFDEWLARVVMFCFSLPPDAFVRQRNRSTSETARQTALEEGLAPLMSWVKRLVDGVIQKRMGYDDLEFAWQEIKETDPKVQADVFKELIAVGVYKPNEARDMLGLDPDPAGNNLMLISGATVTLLEDVEALSDRAANPPEPMFGGPPGMPGQSPGKPGEQGKPATGNPAANGKQSPQRSAPQPQHTSGAPRAAKASEVGEVADLTFLETQEAEAGAGPEYDRDQRRRRALADEIGKLLSSARAGRIAADSEAVGA